MWIKSLSTSKNILTRYLNPDFFLLKKVKREIQNAEKIVCQQLVMLMRRSIRKFNIPPGNPLAFRLLKIGLFKFPPLGAKKPFKCPTN